MFHQFIVSFLNGCIQKELVNPQQHLIKKLDGRKTQNITLTHNKELLFSTVRDCLVIFMSEKYKIITKEENRMTAQFKCVFSANNQRITQIVTANSAMEAKKIIELQYRGLRLIWWECRKL